MQLSIDNTHMETSHNEPALVVPSGETDKSYTMHPDNYLQTNTDSTVDAKTTRLSKETKVGVQRDTPQI